jgi:hypothetical protein
MCGESDELVLLERNRHTNCGAKKGSYGGMRTDSGCWPVELSALGLSRPHRKRRIELGRVFDQQTLPDLDGFGSPKLRPSRVSLR